MNTLIAGSNKMVGSAVTHHLMIRKTLLVCGILSALIRMGAGQKRSVRIIAGLLFASEIVDLMANFFPWDPSKALGTLANIIHGILAGGLTGLLFLLTIAFGANADGKWFRYYLYGTILAIIGASGVMASFGNIRIEGVLPPPWFGLTERINAYGFMLWMLALSVILLRAKPASSSLLDSENIIVPDAVTGEKAHG